VAALAWHEVALALSAGGLLWMSRDAPNQVGAMAFALLLAMRPSTKIAIFLGVPNMSTDILPQHLAYLKSYFGKPRLGVELYAAIAACLALAAWLATVALAAPADSAEAAGASLLFALAALGALEHLFLALPMRDGALWGWRCPRATLPTEPEKQPREGRGRWISKPISRGNWTRSARKAAIASLPRSSGTAARSRMPRAMSTKPPSRSPCGAPTIT
jgi:hypothetical protein